ncbi:hypothetical protein [Myxococcus sp. RHSTA-1-4]|uniref:hypothetical protein n=1 Tax=Myxococcus sp. RHSTA-1-4 TaxID=2874601 RepID=UPI001CBEE6DD|nr:hypothetical protein [Myxococcus sp. RHSTA-1-4]MBZ4418722.1 hypothetical protein [Myxococcus sp. RHSTA-1-4]
MKDEAVDPEHASLLVAIGRALGSDGPYLEVEGEPGDALHLGTRSLLPVGTRRVVLGGAVDPATGRVAWVEQLTGEPDGDGHVPVSIDLHFAWEGRRQGQVEVPTYNPYFGCDVGFMGWYGGALVVIYREKHRTLAVRLSPPATALEVAVLGDTWALDEDTVYFVSHHPGLIEGRLLPSLARALPLPIPRPPGAVQFWRHAPGTLALAPYLPFGRGDTRDSYRARLEAARGSARLVPLPPRGARALPGPPERLWKRLEELLAETAPPLLGVDVLVGAVAAPFWRDETPLATGYTSGSQARWSSPRYLPVYWYRLLREDGRAAEAEAWLHWLERVARMDGVDPAPWTRDAPPEEVTAWTALRYLRTRARVLARTCRTGRLPERESCHLFSGPRRTRELEEDAFQPPGFREVLRQLVARGPRSLSD